MGRQHEEGLLVAAEYKKMAETGREQGYVEGELLKEARVRCGLFRNDEIT